ncbi:hypothetical protein HIO71_00510 [Chryseobacterium aquaticum]|jgi:hypothetical protein|uniref:Lipoprotein n=1 Tax=Chryseobacterium aquaticum TaxID=452084 RepID=A0A0Q3K7J1_9FLAO|nr:MULTISPECIES: hypothetical protein [Chryseobacterium]KNB60513.1 hypothetical protein AC804_15065 [Chryseobacterium sp. Hurlbut01]KQK25611.1 hypothetical protein AR438_08400 [Chryseobacterium aquaticum]NMR32678.1 hypothetical protein [Chryseobacterium aquaticum]NRQ45392.1 hypothetical protein [Chryseobacterium sp. C-204]
MKKLFLLFVTTFLLIGCTADDDTIYDYIGTWSGKYTGSDKGVWNFVVENDGKVTGTMHSETNNENYNISGRLDASGQLTAELGLPSDGQFTGTLTVDKTGSGNWTNAVPTPTRSGAWTGEKNK